MSFSRSTGLLFGNIIQLCFFASPTVREPEGGLKLYSKGADLVILERLQKGDTNQEGIEAALEVSIQTWFYSSLMSLNAKWLSYTQSFVC